MGSSSATDLLDPVARRERVDADLAAMTGLRPRLEGFAPFRLDLEARLDGCVPPLMVSPIPNREARRRLGIYFDAEEVIRFL